MEYTYKQENFFLGVSGRRFNDMKYGGENPNRLSLLKTLKLNPDKVYGLNQIHSRKVLVVDSNKPPKEDADGMITNDASITLSVTVADCLPVFLLDTSLCAFGIVHSGWKGTGIAAVALKLMKKEYKSNARDISVVLGPCIGSCCYKVEDARAAVFKNEFGEDAVRKDNGNYYLDLKKANVSLLEKNGVKNIIVSKDCTCCNDNFGSFRREGEKFTRMMALIFQMQNQLSF